MAHFAETLKKHNIELKKKEIETLQIVIYIAVIVMWMLE